MKTKNSSLNAADICRANGWETGTMLVGDEGHGLEIIEITAVGREQILALHMGLESVWALDCREWKKVAL